MLSKNQLQKIKEAIVKKPYVFYLVIIFLGYLGLNIWLNQTFVTFSVLFTAYKLSFAIPFVALSLITAFLVAVTINLIILKFKEFRAVNKTSGIAAVAIFLGFVGGACPGCFVGIFPAIVGIFGASLTLTSLPLNGLEIQIASSLILILSIHLLTRNKVCKV